MLNPNAHQEGGDHYNSEYQHWDFVLNSLGGRYLEGCVTKYVARWMKKNGLEDLKKAAHYLDKIMDPATHYERQPYDQESFKARMADAAKFCDLNDCGPKETAIIEVMATWTVPDDLLFARGILGLLIEHVEAYPHLFKIRKSV